MFLFFYLFNVSVCVFTKNGIKLGQGKLDRTIGPVVAVVVMHLAYINLLKSSTHADHPLSVNLVR